MKVLSGSCRVLNTMRLSEIQGEQINLPTVLNLARSVKINIKCILIEILVHFGIIYLYIWDILSRESGI